MINILYNPDNIDVECEKGTFDGEVRFENNDGGLNLYISAEKSKPKFLNIRWNGKAEKPVRVMGDKWERSYGDIAWRGIEPEVWMPWYFAVSDGDSDYCYGVKTGCNSFVSFSFDNCGITACVDIRSGSYGVNLNGKEKHLCTFVCEKYNKTGSFEALHRFCKVMCDNPILPKSPVYGGNNWYYAYGKSSRDEILSDTKLQSRLAEGLENRPFMVIDDCWQVRGCSGPWIANDKFGDMKEVADEIKKYGVRPGIWVRFLTDYSESIPKEWLMDDTEEPTLDPSHPEVLAFISDTIEMFKDWGFELIKHDFSTYDMFGSWGKDINKFITKRKNLKFFDKSKTNAEITLGLYKTIRKAAGDTIVIGCNTVSHLCAGLVEINRIGDDTSGREFAVTRKNGVNTLAFRMCQNGTFYMADADCVGILGDNIPWKLNRQWLDLLSRSGTPLFVSVPDNGLTATQTEDLKKAYRFASEQKNLAEPVDWTYNNVPSVWKIDGEMVAYDWYSSK